MNSINKLRESMQRFNDSHKDCEAFKEKSDKICYIPFNAESLNECYNYNEIFIDCKTYLEGLEFDFKNELDYYAELLTALVFQHTNWEFPFTFLNELDVNSIEELKEILNIK